MKKKLTCILLLLSIGSLAACSHNMSTDNLPMDIDNEEPEIEIVVKEEPEVTVTESIPTTPSMSTEPMDIVKPEEIQKTILILKDYSEIFGERNGCAVIYDTKHNECQVYNESMISTEVSPYSSFKIVAMLMGLKNQILLDETTTMSYNQTQYPNATSDSLPELKGFWLNSSLKISPMEQVQVLQKIFQGQSQYSTEEIDQLKEIMLKDEINAYQILVRQVLDSTRDAM